LNSELQDSIQLLLKMKHNVTCKLDRKNNHKVKMIKNSSVEHFSRRWSDKYCGTVLC